MDLKCVVMYNRNYLIYTGESLFSVAMKFKLSYKIFIAFTLTSLLVVVLMVGLIRIYVARNFTDYVNKSLLERYSDVAAALATEYQTHRGWQALKDNPGRWQEILKLNLPRRDFDLQTAMPHRRDDTRRSPAMTRSPTKH